MTDLTVSRPKARLSSMAAVLRAAGVPPEVSVVIPTRRRPVLLAGGIAALAVQDIQPYRYEIIVCDGGPDADTERVVLALAEKYRPAGHLILYIPVTASQGPAGARNRGWRAAASPVIAFTDDDTMPGCGWLHAGLRAIERGPAAVAGRIHVPLPRRPTIYELDAARLARAEFATANCFVRRSVLERIGGFDQRYTAGWREDSDLQFSIIRAGGIIARADDAVVIHPVAPAHWWSGIAQQKKSQFEALLFKKHKRLYKSRIGNSPPWAYYGAFVFLAAGAAGLLEHSTPVATTGFAGWTILTLWFAAQRLRRTARTLPHVTGVLATSMVIPPLSLFWRLYGAMKFRVPFL
ncbi:MAG: glycosyltransferase [Betaproteobacteria bacterium]